MVAFSLAFRLECGSAPPSGIPQRKVIDPPRGAVLCRSVYIEDRNQSVVPVPLRCRQEQPGLTPRASPASSRSEGYLGHAVARKNVTSRIRRRTVPEATGPLVPCMSNAFSAHLHRIGSTLNVYEGHLHAAPFGLE